MIARVVGYIVLLPLNMLSRMPPHCCAGGALPQEYIYGQLEEYLYDQLELYVMYNELYEYKDMEWNITLLLLLLLSI